MNLLDLPYTVFLEIVSCLPPVDALVCRRISRGAFKVLTSPELCYSLIWLHFPRSREARSLLRSSKYNRHKTGGGGSNDHVQTRRASHDWAAVFAHLTRRYYHLGNGMPRSTHKVEILKDPDLLFAVKPWDRFLVRGDMPEAFQSREPLWTYAAGETLLVYPSTDGLGYMARDLETGLEDRVPFDVARKTIRRVRLNEGVLVFEWCEEQLHYGVVDEQDVARQHFVTAFGVFRDREEVMPFSTGNDGAVSSSPPRWIITFRAEWRICTPMSSQERFFSAHNADHYVVYGWQLNHEPNGWADPLEELTIWELGEPSLSRTENETQSVGGPRVLRSWRNRELNIWGVRQRGAPRLRGLSLDAATKDRKTGLVFGHVFFHEEDHRDLEGPHRSHVRARHHHVKTTGIPLQGVGPMWVDECGCEVIGESILSLSLGGTLLPHQPERDFDPPAWPGAAPCWRHRRYPWLTVSEVVDADAGIRISARHSLFNQSRSQLQPVLYIQGVDESHYRDVERVAQDIDEADEVVDETDGSKKAMTTYGPGEKVDGRDGHEVQFSPYFWSELMAKGVMYGDERWLVGEGNDGDITILQF